MSENTPAAENPKVRSVSIEWVAPVSQPTVLADQMIIQRDDQLKHFILMLFEAKKPILISESDLKNAEDIKSVPAYCVGRFLIPFPKIKSFVEALQNNVKKAEELHGGKLD